MNPINKKSIDINVLTKEYWAGATSTELGEKYGCHRTTIISKLNAAGIDVKDSGGQPIDLGVTDEEIIRLYTEEKLSLEEIGGKFNCSWGPIRNILIKHGIERRPFENCRTYEFDETYFDKIDSEEKAYFFGWIYSDGCNTGVGLSLKIGSIDDYILSAFKNSIKTDANLEYYGEDCTTLRIFSQNLSSKLTKLGCVEAKSLVKKFPTEDQVPREFLLSFLRGYFDGNGSIWKDDASGWLYYCCAFYSSYDFIEGLDNFLKDSYGISGHFRTRKKIGELEFKSQGDVEKVLNLIYQDARPDLVLKRKYDLYLEFLKHKVGLDAAAKERETVKLIDGVEHHKCNRCKEFKIAEWFKKAKFRKSGLYTYCKPCEKLRRSEKVNNELAHREAKS